MSLPTFPEHALLPDGRVRLYAKATGRRYDRMADCAADMLASGDFTTDDPAGIQAIAPSVPVTSQPEQSAATGAIANVPAAAVNTSKSRGKK